MAVQPTRLANVAPRKKERQKKLFLSYGHAEAEIARRIYGWLSSSGYEVFFDERGIRPGDDWRETIAREAQGSDAMITCLSKNALREGGVCHDELDIAVGVRGGSVITVLLDPESKVRPPAYLAHRQWLDLSGWRQQLAKGERTFRRWFRLRMQELTRVLEGPETARVQGDLTLLSQWLAPISDDSRRMRLVKEPFYGRGWLTERVDGWMRSRESPRVCLVTGGPGTGKSAFAVQLGHWDSKLVGRVAASVFCVRDRGAYNKPGAVARSLAYSLACTLAWYRENLRAVQKRGVDLGEMDGRSLFAYLVEEPLSHAVDGDHECVCLVIDAIDEAGTAVQNELADVLGTCMDTLPEFVKVLVTSREVLSALEPFMGNALTIKIEDERVRNASDMLDYLRSSLCGHVADKGFYKHIGAMTRASKGSFLYAKHMVDAVQRGRVTLADATATLPIGLPSLFHQWFQWTFPDLGLYRSKIRDALGCIASAPGGKLPIAELQLLLGWDGNRANDLLLDAGVFLERADDPLGGPSVSIAHAFVSEWLTGPEANVYSCDPHSALRLMGECYYKIASEDVGGLTEWEAAHTLGVLESAGMFDELAMLWSNGGIARRCLDAAIVLRKGNALAGAQDALRPLERFVRESPECDDGLKARILNEHANQLRLVGRIGEALAAYEGALSLRRGLAEADPAFLSDYAESLSNYGCMLQEVGKKDDAERMLCEALSIYRGLLYEDSGAYAPGFAKVHGNLGTFLRQTNRHTVAEEEYRESIETFLSCADEDALCMRYAAHMQDKLGMLLYETGRSTEAEKAVREALRIRRELAEADRVAGMPDVASSYGSLSTILLGLNRVGDAESYIRQALDIFYELEESEPSVFMSQVADCLYKMGACLSARNLKDEALRRYEEALDIWRDLSENEPDMYAPFVARSLCGVGNIMREMGDVKGSRERLEEAVDICRSLVDAGKRQHLSLLADSLNALGIVMCKVDGGIKSAQEMVSEATRIRRGLAESEPTKWLPYVADSQNNLGGIHLAAGRFDKAESVLREALETSRELAKLEPGRWDQRVASSLSNLGMFYYEIWQPEDAELALLEAIDIVLGLCEAEPVAHLATLSRLVENLQVVYQTRGTVEDWRELSQYTAMLADEGPMEDAKARLIFSGVRSFLLRGPQLSGNCIRF